jgi:tetratricopeptide (TPR) repeat protein
MGFLAITFDERFGASADELGRLPTYEAFQEFDRGLELLPQYEYGEALQHFLHAFELDSAFFTALIYASVPVMQERRPQELDSLIQILEAHENELAEYDRHWMQFLQGFRDGDHDVVLRELSHASHVAPQSRATYLHAMFLELRNRPREELSVLSAIDPNRGAMRGNWLYWNRKAFAHHMLGEHDRELEAIREARELYPGEDMLRVPEIVALAALGKIDEVYELLYSIEDWAHGPARAVGRELRAHGSLEAAQEVFDHAVELLLALPPEEGAERGNRYSLGYLMYLAGEWDEALEIVEALVTEYPGERDYVVLLGATAARLGDRERALRMSERLIDLDIDTFWEYGNIPVMRARIAAALGDHSDAISLLQEAFRRGWVSPSRWHQFVEFEPLRDHPEFKELIRPKG